QSSGRLLNAQATDHILKPLMISAFLRLYLPFNRSWLDRERVRATCLHPSEEESCGAMADGAGAGWRAHRAPASGSEDPGWVRRGEGANAAGVSGGAAAGGGPAREVSQCPGLWVRWDRDRGAGAQGEPERIQGAVARVRAAG